MLFDLTVDRLHRLASEAINLLAHFVHPLFVSREQMMGYPAGLVLGFSIGASSFKNAITAVPAPVKIDRNSLVLIVPHLVEIPASRTYEDVLLGIVTEVHGRKLPPFLPL